MHVQSHIEDALTRSVDSDLAAELQSIATVAHSVGMKVYLVGGMLRDAVIGSESTPLSPDVMVIGDAREFAEECSKRIDATRIVGHSQLFTSRIKIRRRTFEIASARTDLYQPHGSLPKISLVDDIREDLSRRDFTVNAMATELAPEGFGTFHDPYDGLADCEQKVLRTVRPNSFLEDPTRILRGMRFAARYGLQFSDLTLADLRAAQNALSDFSRNSPNRFWKELSLWFNPHENLAEMISDARELGTFDALGWSLEPNSLNLADRRLAPAPKDSDTIFAAFLQLLATETLDAIISQMPLTKSWRDLADQTIRFRRLAESTPWTQLRDSEIARLVLRFDESVVGAAMNGMSDRVAADRIATVIVKARGNLVHLTGSDIIRLGIAEGPEVGEVLKQLAALRMDGQISTKEEEVTYVIERATVLRRG